MSLAAKCGLQGLGVRGLGPAAVAEVNTNMQLLPIDQLINNLTSSCRCLLDDLRRMPDMPFRCGLCVVPLAWQPHHTWLVVWHSVNTFDPINEVTLRWAGLVL